MQRIIRMATVALAAVGLVTLGLVGPAQAASNGDHDQAFTCSTTQNGSSTSVHIVFSYHETGVGNSDPNVLHPDQVTWTTSPAAKLSKLTLSMDSGYVWNYNPGADNVPSSGTSTSFFTNGGWANGDPGTIVMAATGGVGTDSAPLGYCQISHAAL
jgi:hypothetical protein